MGKKNTQKEGKVDFLGYVRFDLKAEHKAAIGVMFHEHINVCALQEHLAEKGYKVSVSYKPAQEAFQATAYGNVSDNPNAGYALSFWHSSLPRAIAALYFVIAEVYQWRHWDTVNAYDNSFDW